MQIIIDELVSQIHAMDGDSLLSPESMTRIVSTVLEAVRADNQHQQRVGDELTLDNYQQQMSRRR